MSRNYQKLMDKLLKLSHSQIEGEMLKEWDIDGEENDYTDKCLCGHKPIKENYHIVNTVTGERAVVGNVCIKHFNRYEFDVVTKAVAWYKKFEVKLHKPIFIDEDLLDEAYGRWGVINEWEYDFLNNVRYKISRDTTSVKQDKTAFKIELKIQRYIKKKLSWL